MVTTISLPPASQQAVRRLKLFTYVSAIAVMAVGALVLTGWALDIGALKSVVPGLTTMKASTALGLLLAGAALLLLAEEVAARWRRRAGAACAVIVTLTGLLTLGEYLFGADFGIDQLLLREEPGAALTGQPGRMGANTALCFILTGGTLLLLGAISPSIVRFAQGLVLAALVIALAALIGYAFGVAYLLRLISATQMALHTALAFVVLSAGLIAARPRRPLAAMLTSGSPGGTLLRGMWPQSILLLVLLGWLRLTGERLGLYEHAFGTGLLVLAGILLFSLLIWRAARILDRLDIERAEAREAARETDARLHVTLRSIGDAVIATDAAGRISFMNAIAEALTGWTEAEATGRPLPEVFRIVNEQTRAIVENPVTKVIREGVIIGLANHTLLIARDGREIPIDDSGAPIRDEAGEVAGAVLVFRDITERKRVEQTLRASEERYRIVAETATDAIISIDERSTILYVNPAAERVFGYRVEEMMGQSLTKLMPEYLRQVHRMGLRRYLDTGERHLTWEHVEVPGLHRDGHEIPLELSFGEIIADGRRMFVGVARDTTVRKQAEEELRYQLDLNRTITDNTQSCLLMMDTEGRGTFANPATERITGFMPEELIGEVLHYKVHHTHPDGSPFPIDECPLDRALPLQEAVVGLEDTFVHKDGHFYPVRCSGRPIFKDGKPVGTVIEVRDISEEKRLLEAERKARELAEAANRLKDEFLATVSHELRTPLNHMLGWVLMLRSGSLDPDKAAEAMEVIERNVRAQNRLVEDLLDVSRIVTGKMHLHVQPVAPATIVEAAVASARPAAEAKEIRLQVVLDSRPCAISGDPDRLQQIVWNLVSNAIKFTPKGGRVQVRLERINSHVEITVSDTGEGIAPEFLPYVFSRFSQADGSIRRKHSGLGLGLAIVRHLVELHGGEVFVTSPGLGQGATFKVKLPLTVVHWPADEPERQEPFNVKRAVMETAPRLDGVRVLVVDDEADSRVLLSAILTESGAEARAVGSMAEALNVLNDWRPDVLVSDIGLPNGDGYDLIHEVRRRDAASTRWLPAVALTAYARSEDRMRALAAGFQMHLAKPVEPSEMLTVIASLSGRLAWN